ncbi:hypothetical protein CB1_000091003 [Camelus ferus]|nr:hypothetical protein CB1_000091003 [Camelus ferus]
MDKTKPLALEASSRHSTRNLTEYFVAVDVNNMLHLYASMLYERRILIICSKLSTLTACIHGSAAMLYPMFWQHVYIPVLPPHLLDYCWLIVIPRSNGFNKDVAQSHQVKFGGPLKCIALSELAHSSLECVSFLSRTVTSLTQSDDAGSSN